MKKISLLTLMLLFTFASSVQALSWAIIFVVWDGKVYEVKQDEIIDREKIGEEIGEVKTKPNEETGKYYGNASNYFPIGTKYYEIKDISTSDAIAIKENDQWIKAVYVHDAPFHYMNIMKNPLFIFSIVIVFIMIIGMTYRKIRVLKLVV